MELSTVLIGIGALLLFVGPIAYLSWSQKKGNSNFSNHFLELAQERDLNIVQSDFWNTNYGIGIDPDSKKLLYLKKKENNENETLVIDLKKAESCKMQNDSRIIKGTTNEVIDNLSLLIKFKDVKIQDKKIEFYNSDESISLNGELDLVKKWSDIVNADLRK